MLIMKLKTLYPSLATRGIKNAALGKTKDSNKIANGAIDFLGAGDHAEIITRMNRSIKRGPVRHKDTINTTLFSLDNKAVVMLEFSGTCRPPRRSGEIVGIMQTVKLIQETTENKKF